MLVPDQEVDDDGQDLAEDPNNGEEGGRDSLPQHVGGMGHAYPDEAREQQREDDLHVGPLDLIEDLLFVEAGEEEGQREEGDKVSVPDSSPVCHLDIVAHVLGVDGVKDEKTVPGSQPCVSLDFESIVHHYVACCSEDEEEEAEPASSVRPGSSEEKVVTKGKDNRGRGTKGDEGLDVGVLEDLDVAKDSAEEAEDYPNESFELVPLDLVGFEVPEGVAGLDGEGRDGQLAEQDKGGCRDEVDGHLWWYCDHG